MKKYLPKDGKEPIKGVKGGRVMCIVPDQRVVKFNLAPYIQREYIEENSLCLIELKAEESRKRYSLDEST